MKPGSEILVSRADRIVWVRVEGNGSSTNSTALRDFAKEMIHRGAREFIVDLCKCPVMDSTFMGTLAGISLWLGELGECCLSVVNLNERNAESLCSLGLDQLFNVRVSAIKKDGQALPIPLRRPHRSGADDVGSDTKAHQPALAGDGVYQNVGRLDILVDDAALMQVTNRSRKANGQTQRKRYVHWLTEQLIKRHTAWIRRNKYRTVPVASNCNRSGSPGGIQLFFKRIFVLESFQAFRRGTLHRRRKHKNLRCIVLTLPAIKDKLFIVPQRLEDISQ